MISSGPADAHKGVFSGVLTMNSFNNHMGVYTTDQTKVCAVFKPMCDRRLIGCSERMAYFDS